MLPKGRSFGGMLRAGSWNCFLEVFEGPGQVLQMPCRELEGSVGAPKDTLGFDII